MTSATSNKRAGKKARSEDETTLINRAEGVRKRWEVALASEEALTPYSNANGVLRRGVYNFVRTARDKGISDLMEDLVRAREKRVRASENNQANPFYWGLLLVCGYDRRLSATTRNRFVQEMLYADLHDVPTEFLVGFLYQVADPNGLQRRLDEAMREDWYVKKQEKLRRLAQSGE